MPVTPNQYVMAPDRHAEVSDQTLRFSEDGTFQISVFEDLHFAEGIFLSEVALLDSSMLISFIYRCLEGYQV